MTRYILRCGNGGGDNFKAINIDESDDENIVDKWIEIGADFTHSDTDKELSKIDYYFVPLMSETSYEWKKVSWMNEKEFYEYVKRLIDTASYLHDKIGKVRYWIEEHPEFKKKSREKITKLLQESDVGLSLFIISAKNMEEW